jgi:predicted dithiol-disulfide oxidoreductase (DUF899 family)
MIQNEGPRYGWIEGESEKYRELRKKLHAAELELRDQRERVATLRRKLPLDTLVPDYAFREGPGDLREKGPIKEVRLSELTTRDRPTVLYQFMYGRAQKKPCPMCSMWIDGFRGVARHLRETMTFAVVAAAPIEDLRAWGAKQGWDSLRLLSCAETSFKSDLHFEEPDGTQLPGFSVFALDGSGALRHFYSVSAILAEKEYRGIDLLTPVWNLLDLTPAGRGEWMPSLKQE